MKKLPIKKLKQTQTKNKYLKLAEQLEKSFSLSELKVILQSGKAIVRPTDVLRIKHSGKIVKFGIISDTHMGSIFFKEELYDDCLDMFTKEKCEFICHCGDLVEGMSGRPGHIYEVTHLGFAKQKEYAKQQLSKWKKPIYIIDGNHDRWFVKSSGALIVKDIADELSNVKFLGHDSGTLCIDNIKIQLWHGEDGSSYAISYRLQKLVESLTGGTKPNIFIAGHVHKHMYAEIRNIHVISAGAGSMQSPWMKSKRIDNHFGVWVCEFQYNKSGIVRFKPEWFPFYV